MDEAGDEWVFIFMFVMLLIFCTGIACLCYLCYLGRFRNVHATSIIDAHTTPAFEEISLRAANSVLSINNEHSPGHNIDPVEPRGDAEDIRLRGETRHRYSIDSTSISDSDTKDGDAGDRGSPSGDRENGPE